MKIQTILVPTDFSADGEEALSTAVQFAKTWGAKIVVLHAYHVDIPIASPVAGGDFVMALWGIFAVPNDPSRSGNAPVAIPGVMRLVLELSILLGGAYAWYLGGFTVVAAVFTALVVFHYLLSIERIIWLLQQ